MRIQSKVVLALITFAVALPMAFAQDAAPAQAASPATMNQRQQFQRRPMGPPQMNRRSPGSFQEGRHWAHRNRGMHRHFMLANLVRNPSFRARIGITPEQAQKIETQTFNFRKAMIDNRATLEVKHLELGQLLSAATPDRNAINQKLQEISAARLAQSKAMIDFRLDMRAALTSEQRQKMQQMRRDFRHHGFGPQGPGAPGSSAPSPTTEG